MMKKERMLDWAFRHGMYSCEANTPFEYMKKLNDYQMVDVGSRITQDVPVIGARFMLNFVFFIFLHLNQDDCGD